jgi:hypothetical protein
VSGAQLDNTKKKGAKDETKHIIVDVDVVLPLFFFLLLCVCVCVCVCVRSSFLLLLGYVCVSLSPYTHINNYKWHTHA